MVSETNAEDKLEGKEVERGNFERHYWIEELACESDAKTNIVLRTYHAQTRY